MALQTAEVSLIASRKGDFIVTPENFLHPLKVGEAFDAGIVTSFNAPAIWHRSGYISLIEEDVRNYLGEEFPDSYVTHLFEEKLSNAAQWIEERIDELIEISELFKLELLMVLQIHSGQVDLSFSVDFLSACSRAHLPVKILTNV